MSAPISAHENSNTQRIVFQHFNGEKGRTVTGFGARYGYGMMGNVLSVLHSAAFETAVPEAVGDVLKCEVPVSMRLCRLRRTSRLRTAAGNACSGIFIG